MATADARIAGPKIKLELWEKLYLQTTREGRDFTFLSRVVEQSAREIIIEYPIALQGGGALLVGARVRVTLTRPDAVWAFSAKVTGKIAGQTPRMTLTSPRSIERNQRRRFVRIDYLCPCKWRPVCLPEKNQEGEAIGEQTGGTIINLSAGGVLLAADEPPKIGEYLIIKPLSEDWPLPGWLPGLVVWRHQQPEEHKYRMSAGVDFREFEDMTAGWPKHYVKKLPEDILNLSHAVRQKLMQLVYWKQIDVRKKGLL